MTTSNLCKKWNNGGYTEERGGETVALCNNQFNGSRGGVPFEIKRPSFKSGVIYEETRQAENIDHINQRTGTGTPGCGITS